MTISLNSLIKRQTPSSKFSHFRFSNEELLARIQSAFDEGGERVSPGYREGVLLVKIDPKDVLSSVVKLYEGDPLNGYYESRQKDEEPRKSHHVFGKKSEAASAFVVLYAHHVLAEGKENESDDDFEAICLIASPEEIDVPPPMDPDTLMANHFLASGGTQTLMSSDEFVAELKRSYEYWKNKSLCYPIYS